MCEDIGNLYSYYNNVRDWHITFYISLLKGCVIKTLLVLSYNMKQLTEFPNILTKRYKYQL